MTRRKKKLPPYPRHLPCVIVAVDQARTSGWAIVLAGKPVSWGALDAADHRAIERVLREACELGQRLKLPVVLLGEEHGRYGFKGGAQAGLGGAWKSWTWTAKTLRKHERLDLVDSRILRVNTQTWRATFGIASLRSQVSKRAALSIARSRHGICLEPAQHDTAEAILIGTWGSRAGAVGARLPKRVMRECGLLRPGRGAL